MSDTKTKTYEHRGVTITPTYVSPNGTGRTCKTVQGYEYMAHHGAEWSPSLTKAKQRIEAAWMATTGEAPLTPSHQAAFLRWLVRTWDSKLAQAEIDRRALVLTSRLKKEAEEAKAKEWAREVLRAAASQDPTLARALEILGTGA